MKALRGLRGVMSKSGQDTGTGLARKASWRDKLNTPRGRMLVGAAIVAALVLAFALARPAAVTVATVSRGAAIDVVYATGVVDFVRQARLAPIVTAPIHRVLVEEGESVRRGALLAQLDDGAVRATAAQLAAQAQAARSAASRVQTLYQRGFASRAAWDDARGARDAAEAAARSARERLDDYAIRAPFAGAVLRREAEPGDQATPSRVLFVIADQSSLRITADLDERDIARVAVGQPALIRADAFPGQTFDARVAEVTPQGDSTTRVFRVRLSLDPETPLRAGMTVEANIISGEREDALLAPASAVRDGVAFVVARNRVQRREVQVGASGEARVEILEGLAEGDVVVLDPPDSLRDGQTVRVRNREAAE